MKKKSRKIKGIPKYAIGGLGSAMSSINNAQMMNMANWTQQMQTAMQNKANFGTFNAPQVNGPSGSALSNINGVLDRISDRAAGISPQDRANIDLAVNAMNSGNIPQIKKPWEQSSSTSNNKGGGSFQAGTVNPMQDAAIGAQLATAGFGALAGMAPESNVTEMRDVKTQSVADVNNGMLQGAQMGSSFGPWGAAIGAGVGGIIGAIGRKGREAEMTSFTDYDQGTYGTGFLGLRQNKRLKRKRRAVKANALNNRAAVSGTEYLRSEYAEDNTLPVDTNTFAQGGVVPSSLAYVDDGELIKTPQGDIIDVPERGKPVDSNLIDLPEGSRVLSDHLKVPGTKKTFAEMGKELTVKKRSKGKDRFAENANRLNDMNDNLILDGLFAQQEALKAKRGLGKESKNGLQEFQTGGQSGPWTPYIYNNQGFPDQRYAGEISMGVLPPTRRTTIIRHAAPIGPQEFTPEERIDITAGMTPAAVHPAAKTSTTSNATTATTPVATASTVAEPSVIKQSLDLIEEPKYELDPVSMKKTTTDKGDLGGNNWPMILANVAGSIGALTPVISDLTTRPEFVDAIYNPYTSAISNTMRNRRFDIEPAMRDIARNRVINDYNASQQNTNTGANMAFRLQNAIASNREIANLRAQQSAVNNAYAADYASIMNDLGQQFVNAENLARDTNLRSKAAARNIRRTGLKNLGAWFQNNTQMLNQYMRDRAMMQMYYPFLSQGYTDEQIDSMLRNMNMRVRTGKGGND